MSYYTLSVDKVSRVKLLENDAFIKLISPLREACPEGYTNVYRSWSRVVKMGLITLQNLTPTELKTLSDKFDKFKNNKIKLTEPLDDVGVPKLITIKSKYRHFAIYLSLYYHLRDNTDLNDKAIIHLGLLHLTQVDEDEYRMLFEASIKADLAMQGLVGDIGSFPV